jgi:leader peptidase (prepilin peptidase) / N-methyltransferase
MTIILIAFAACFGLILGSFFNVLIWRLPREESIAWPPSHCPRCNRRLGALENIPVISYLVLRGKCSGCSEPISIQYPLIEIVTMIAAMVIWQYLPHPVTGRWWDYVPYFVKAFWLLVIIPVTLIDLRHYIIPDAINLPLLAAGAACSFIPGDITPIQSGLGILAGGGSLYAAGFIGAVLFRKKEAMGGGDIKMMAAVGAIWGPQIALFSIVFGAFLGSIAGISLILIKRLASDRKIPFGPYLGGGLWIAVFWGDSIFEWYMNFVNGLLFP